MTGDNQETERITKLACGHPAVQTGPDVAELRKVAGEMDSQGALLQGVEHFENWATGVHLQQWSARILKALKEEPCPSPCKSSAGCQSSTTERAG